MKNFIDTVEEQFNEAANEMRSEDINLEILRFDAVIDDAGNPSHCELIAHYDGDWAGSQYVIEVHFSAIYKRITYFSGQFEMDMFDVLREIIMANIELIAESEDE